MLAGFHAAWRALRHLNQRGYVYIWANVAWVALSLPLVTAPAAWAGLMLLSYRALRQPHVTIDDFWEGFRATLRQGAALALVNLVVVVVNVSNLLSYGAADALTSAARIVWVGAVGVWFALQYALWGIYWAMERPTLRGALRNALVLFARHPLYMLTILALAFVIMLVSTALPAAWLLLTGAALAVLMSSAVQDRLALAGYASQVSSLGEA